VIIHYMPLRKTLRLTRVTVSNSVSILIQKICTKSFWWICKWPVAALEAERRQAGGHNRLMIYAALIVSGWDASQVFYGAER